MLIGPAPSIKEGPFPFLLSTEYAMALLNLCWLLFVWAYFFYTSWESSQLAGHRCMVLKTSLVLAMKKNHSWMKEQQHATGPECPVMPSKSLKCTCFSLNFHCHQRLDLLEFNQHHPETKAIYSKPCDHCLFPPVQFPRFRMISVLLKCAFFQVGFPVSDLNSLECDLSMNSLKYMYQHFLWSPQDKVLSGRVDSYTVSICVLNLGDLYYMWSLRFPPLRG